MSCFLPGGWQVICSSVMLEAVAIVLLAQAYVFEMDEEYSESDIPTVLIRSKADCPVQEVG